MMPHRSHRTAALALLPLALLAACSGGGERPASASAAPPPMAGSFGAPGAPLLGMDAKKLVSMLGQPRLDIRDRTVRKMQFANGRCVIDAYLYALAKGREPQVTHIDARLPTGEDAPVASCGISGR